MSGAWFVRCRPKQGQQRESYAEYQAEKTGTSWKGKLKFAVDALIPQVSSFEELLSKLQAAGYEIKRENTFPAALLDRTVTA